MFGQTSHGILHTGEAATLYETYSKFRKNTVKGNKNYTRIKTPSIWGQFKAVWVNSTGNREKYVYDDIDKDFCFKLKDKIITRGRSKLCRLDVRKYAFSYNIVNLQNKLPGSWVDATSVDMFKNTIDNCFHDARMPE